jgi:hypothetical protein
MSDMETGARGRRTTARRPLGRLRRYLEIQVKWGRRKMAFPPAADGAAQAIVAQRERAMQAGNRAAWLP